MIKKVYYIFILIGIFSCFQFQKIKDFSQESKSLKPYDEDPIIKEIGFLVRKNVDYKLHFILKNEKIYNDTPNQYSLNIYKNGNLIFEDLNDFKYFADKKNIRIVVYKNFTYIFCKYTDLPNPPNWRVFMLKRGEYERSFSLNADIGIDFFDIDGGGLIEFGGLPEFIENKYCSDCDTAYYISNRIYQISNKIYIDSNLTRQMNINTYGFHLDFSRGEKKIHKRSLTKDSITLKKLFFY